MTRSGPSRGEPRAPGLPVRSLHVVGRNGEEIVHTSVYCLLRESSVPLAECERCERFHALHFDVESRKTSVLCDCEPAASALAAEALRKTQPDPKAPLSDIMATTVVGVLPDTDIDDVMALLTNNAINSVPVVDKAGQILGMISRADILRAERESRDMEEVRPVSARPGTTGIAELDEALEPGMHISEPVTTTALDVMSLGPTALHERSNVGQAASLMAFEGIHCLPVTADRGEVVGVVSALDVLCWFGRHSGYIIPAPRLAA
jgi:CBS domain-containing protein